MSEEIDKDEITLDEDLEEVEERQEEEAPAEQDVDPELEAEARKYGWKPKGEFTLAPEGWVDASRFMELPSTLLKVQRDTNRRLERELGEYRSQIERLGSVQQKAIERVREQERQAYESKVAALERAKREAAEVGDVQRYDQIEAARSKLTPPEPLQVEPMAPQVDQGLKEYMEASKWVQDPAAYRFAYREIEENPRVKALPPLKQVQWVEARVKEFFPEHFEAPRARPTTAKVDAGGLGALGKRGKGADDLPADVRSVGEMYVKEGVYKNLSEYAKDYFEQEAGR